MKKIININLSGRVIPIEDSAYEKLQVYIESLRRYFAHEDGRDEIINDIESRIAELMNEKTRRGSDAITDADIEEIIGSMGRVEDFEAVEEEKETSFATGSNPQPATEPGYSYRKKDKGRLYRDSSDKILGGVCSGMANYLDIDPAIVRILFAIISFGAGLGFLLYIILWIILPARDLENYSGKRLYRNPEDKVISGVAGGLAAYFGKSASTIRLIFAAPMLLNILFGILNWPMGHVSFLPNILFGSLTGTFIFIYIVLWIVLPEAYSEYQKMEMRGERVDVNRIRQNVQEGMGNVKERMKNWGEEVKDSAQNISGKASEFVNTRGRTFAREARETARRGGRGLGHVIGVLFKAFFLFIAGTIALALFVALIGILIGGFAVWPLKDFLLDGFWQNAYGMGVLILFLGVPVVAFLVWLIRRIMKVRSTGRSYLGWTFGGLWAIGWICLFLFVGSIMNDFRMSNYRQQGEEMAITQPVNGRMIIKVSEQELLYSGTFPWINIDGDGLDITRDTLKTANIHIDEVLLSEDSNFHIEIKKYSRGRSLKEAEDNASKIVFYSKYADSVLDLGSSIAIAKQTKFRGQQVRIRIKVPAGKKIRFDESIDKLHSFTINFNEGRRYGRKRVDWEYDEGAFSYRTNTDYSMGTDGELKDANGVKASDNVNNDYRYPSAGPRDTVKPADTRNKIEEEQRKIRESQQRIKQLQQQAKPSTMRTAGSSFAMGPSPVSSMTQWF